MSIIGFKCGKCGVIFDDPDTCMFHFIAEHPREEEENDEPTPTEETL